MSDRKPTLMSQLIDAMEEAAPSHGVSKRILLMIASAAIRKLIENEMAELATMKEDQKNEN